MSSANKPADGSPAGSEPARSGRSYCKAAFEQLHIAIGGQVKPCCIYEGEIGNVRATTPEDIWNGPRLGELRSKMQHDESDVGCIRCYDLEDAGAASLRQYYNGDVSSLSLDADAPAMPKRLDVRLSNRCNLKCRTCGPDASSRWFTDAKKLGWIDKTQTSALVEAFGADSSALASLEPTLDTLEEILFAGGEPLILEDHYAIIEELIRRGRTDVRLAYISNLTELRFGKKDILALWSQFEDVDLTVSMDGHGKIGELVRDGISWERFEKNVSAVRTACPHVTMHFNITVSVFNVHSLPSLCRSLNAIAAAGDVECCFNLLQEPRHMSVQILPAAMKAEVSQRLEAFAATYEGTRGQSQAAMAEQVRSVINYMMFKDASSEIRTLRRHTRRLDDLREQDTAAVIPELAPVLRETFGDVVHRKVADNRRAIYGRMSRAFASKA